MTLKNLENDLTLRRHLENTKVDLYEVKSDNDFNEMLSQQSTLITLAYMVELFIL